MFTQPEMTSAPTSTWRGTDGLARERGGIELCLAFDDDAVDRHALAGLDHDLVAHGDLVWAHLHEFAVPLDVGVVGCYVHHGADRLAALAHGVCLEQLADLVEQHDGGALRHMGLGPGERDHGKRADGRDGHEEALVERLAAADVAPGFEQDVVAGDEVGG